MLLLLSSLWRARVALFQNGLPESDHGGSQSIWQIFQNEIKEGTNDLDDEKRNNNQYKKQILTQCFLLLILIINIIIGDISCF